MAAPYSDGGTGPSASSSAGTVSLASSSAGVPAPAGGAYATAGSVPPLAAGADLGPTAPGWRWVLIHLDPVGVAFELVRA